MKLFYVYGSGFGHLNRVINYIRSRKYTHTECVILTNSKHINLLPKDVNINHRPDSFFKNHANFHTELLNLIKKYQIDEFIVDVFPCGFYGELNRLKSLNIKKTLLSRILNQTYFNQFDTPYFDELIVFEKGIELHNYKYGKQISTTLNLKTRYTRSALKLKKPFFYIIHSEPIEEVIQLYEFAKLYQKQNEHIYIQTFNKIDSLDCNDNLTFILSEKLVLSLLEESQKIFIACGFNTVVETSKYRKKQYFLPFKRRYDNQFKRKSMLEI